MPGPSLNEVLDGLGYKTKPAGNGKKHIIKNDITVFTGSAGDVWQWLESTSIHPKPEPEPE